MIYFDRWVIASLLGVTAVTYYTTPFDMVFRLSVLSQSVIAALFPALSTLYAMKLEDSAVRAAGVAARFVLLVVGLVGIAVILLAEDVLALWLGAEFARESSTVLQVLTVGLVINSVARIPYATVQALGRPDVTAKLHMAELPVYVALLAVCTRAYGLVGAATAWTVRVAIDGILLFVAERRLTGETPSGVESSRIARGGLLIGASAAAAATASAAQSPSLRVAAAASLVCIAATLGHRLVLDRQERQVLRDLLAKGLAAVAR
jgi:O-antigen/teichoic acid export membrane protein